MPKNTSKNKPEPKKAAGTSSIRIGNIELSNVDLQSIVKESEDLQKNPEFMKSLNQFALEKSKEIVNAAEISSEIKKKPASPPQKAAKEEAISVQMNFSKTAPTSNAQKVQKNAKVQKNVAPPPPPPPPTKANNKSGKKSQKHLVNPNGEDTAYYQMPVDCESYEFDPNLGVHPPTHMPRFEISKQFFQKPKVIAEQLLSGQFPFTFPFKIDVFFGLTGCIRQCTYFYSGQNTWEIISTAFRHKYCESEIYQWFYMNYAGEMMEITDTLSLVQMLITHGACPKGAYETVPDVGKVLCVSRSRYTENQIFERESDLILGMLFTGETCFTKQSSQFAEYLPYQLAPNYRYAEYYEKMLATEGKREPYDGYFVIGDLVMKCQRRLDLDDLFKDPRSKTVTNNDLQALLINSFKNPYKNCSPVESMQLEFTAILSELKKSKHQTVTAYDYIERQLKDQIRKIIRESR